MPKYPQCPRCGDNLSQLTRRGIVETDPCFPEGVCELCATDLQRLWDGGRIPPNQPATPASAAAAADAVYAADDARRAAIPEELPPTAVKPPGYYDRENCDDEGGDTSGDVQEQLRGAAARATMPKDLTQDESSLRDYFAAAALTGLLTNPPEFPAGAESEINLAYVAYDLADAMLVARAAKVGPKIAPAD